ncbi:hypothetical protein E2C01_032985 [Portunus trituberculatus]|uniref:Uncharacterized protein n=1 Tax=Portunus trituberculatus TaxID=210409 RepID=A0A5B7F2P7_PORTR|nr:hypothetical protein [Portunus trituberculatus]
MPCLHEVGRGSLSFFTLPLCLLQRLHHIPLVAGIKLIRSPDVNGPFFGGATGGIIQSGTCFRLKKRYDAAMLRSTSRRDSTSAICTRVTHRSLDVK